MTWQQARAMILERLLSGKAQGSDCFIEVRMCERAQADSTGLFLRVCALIHNHQLGLLVHLTIAVP